MTTCQPERVIAHGGGASPLVPARNPARSILEPFYAWVDRNPDQLLYAFLDIDGRTTESYTYAQFLQRTTDIATHLRGTRKLSPGDRVLLAYPPGVEMICAFFACVRLGLIPVPVYPPAGSGFQAALAKTDFIARDCDAAAVLTDRSYYWSMRLNEMRHRVTSLSLKRSAATRLDWIVSNDAPVGTRADFADAHSPILFLQYTSGSTSEPKGVMVSHENILDNCVAVVDHRPVGVSWLPQYHDMGLIGYYIFFAMMGGTTYGFSPFDFIRRPALWLETITKYRGSASSAPNFAYEYCLRPDKISDEAVAGFDLSSLRFLMTAAEPVRADVCEAFLRRFQPRGLDPKAFFSAYGLAEFTLAVANYGRVSRSFDRSALNQRLVRPARPDAPSSSVTTLVSCGRPLGKTEVRIVDVAGENPRQADGSSVGEIWIRGPSKCGGYWGRPQLSASTFEARLHGDRRDQQGWLRTGDMGFVHEGELFICGRHKDMVIVRGQNYFPQDIELVVEGDRLIRKGCTAAFAAETGGTETVTVVAEVRNPKQLPDARELNKRLLQSLGVTAASFVFIAPRTIPKTSSGKIARHLVRQRWLDGSLQMIDRVDLDTAAEATDAPSHRAWLSRFGLTGDETWTLRDAAFDSIKLVEFSHALKLQLERDAHQDLAAAVDLRVLQKIAICELMDLLDEVAAAAPHARLRFRRALTDLGEEHRAIEAEMMRRDSAVAFDAAALARSRAPRRNGDGAVVLTGATGFFGPFMLSSLLRQGAEDIYVISRGNGEAKRRVHEGLQLVSCDGHAPPDWERRVKIIHGDLAAPNLGLSENDWEEMADRAHTIYHSGAQVNYLMDYPTMRDANVRGTHEVVRLAMSQRPKVLNHVSTTFIFGWSVKETLFETDANERMERLDFGYSQSKWVSEQVVLEAMKRGLDARIFRPALLTPSVAGGGHNFDISIRLLSFMLAHGISTTAGNQVSFSPADRAADNIVAVSRVPESVNATYHVTRDEYATLAEITGIMGRLTGRDFQYFPLHDFVPEVIQRCRPGDILFPLLEFLVRSVDNISAMEFKRYDNSGYRRFRDLSPDGKPDLPLEDVVQGILRFMRKQGLVEHV